MTPSQVLLLAFLVGVVAGLRSLTAPAVVAWAAHRNWINLRNTILSFMGSTSAVVIFTLLAVVELIADKLPSTPSRTKPLGLIGRIVLGGLSGAGVAVSGAQFIVLGAVLGVVGGIAGACGLRSSHASREGSQGPGLGHRSFGRRGGDWRRSLDCVAVLDGGDLK